MNTEWHRLTALFESHKDATEFVAFVEARSGMDWSQQSDSTLERLKAVWERERK